VSARELITEHLDLWTGAVTKKSSSGRGSNGKVELTGVKKLRELICGMAVQGKLTTREARDEPASDLLQRISARQTQLYTQGKIKKRKKLPSVSVEEQHFHLPDNWEWTRLGALFDSIMSGGTPSKQIPRFWDGDIPWASVKDLGKTKHLDETQDYITEEGLKAGSKLAATGDVLICTRMGLGKVAICSKPIAINQDLKAVKVSSEVSLDYFFLAYTTLDITGTGTTVAGITQDKLLNYVIGLPPIEEQHRIVQKVDELMALCDRLEQQTSDQLEAHETLVDTLLGTLTQSENATELADNWARLAAHFDTLFTTEQSIDKLKQTILQLAVMGRLVEQDSGDEPATEALKRIQAGKDQLSQLSKQRKAKPLPPISESEEPFSLPSGWTLSRLDDITDIQGGIAKGKKVSGKKTRTLPYLRVANVQRSSLDLSEIKEIEIAEDEVERYLVRRRDLLITEGGDWDKVGRTAIWDGRIEPMAHQNHVFRARLILAEQNERWLERYLNSQFARDYFAGSSKQTTNLASINKTQLRSCTVPLPPLAEQNRIIQKVDELMALCDQLKERLNQASETRCQLAETIVEQGLSA
jgi:type I restriction enzyme S subunit